MPETCNDPPRPEARLAGTQSLAGPQGLRLTRTLRIMGLTAALSVLGATATRADLLAILTCTGATACQITNAPRTPLAQDPNDGQLWAWNERQNVILQDDLPLDRIADPGSPYVKQRADGTWAIRAGTLVSSHYVQWDSGGPSEAYATATLRFDAPVFGLITLDPTLFDTDETLGHPDVTYVDFYLRGLEEGDWTRIHGDRVDLGWWTGSPGDWTRVITAGALVSMAR